MVEQKALSMSKHSGKTLIESAYEALRQDIIKGTHAPESKLRIEELRKFYDTGASPLREALNRLAGEGFVTVEGQRGFSVAPLSLKGSQRYYPLTNTARMRSNTRKYSAW